MFEGHAASASGLSSRRMSLSKARLAPSKTTRTQRDGLILEDADLSVYFSFLISPSSRHHPLLIAILFSCHPHPFIAGFSFSLPTLRTSTFTATSGSLSILPRSTKTLPLVSSGVHRLLGSVQLAMLRRNSSRNKQRRPLGRSKSTNSVVRNPVHTLESIDPIVAERDAHIAATLSYYRAMGRNSSDMPAMAREQSGVDWARSNNNNTSTHGLSRSESTVSRQDAADTACPLKRQQSVRFAGPNARPRKPLASRARANTGSRTEGPLRLRVLGDANPRSDDVSLRTYIDRLQPPPEYYTPEDDVASVPSSYRKLRKSKSMFTPTPAGSQDKSSELTRRWVAQSRFSILNKENEPMTDATTGLRAPKSTSFLRQRREQTASRTSSRAENDLAVQLAREKFRDQVEQQSRLKSHPSMFFRSRFKSSESSTGFRRSLRNVSNNSTGLSSAFSNNSLSIAKHSGLRKTARKVSQSLKGKLKGLFRKSKSANDTPGEPEGHTRDHESDDDSCLDVEDLPPPEEASMSRVTSRMPSLHAVPSNQQMRSHQGSMESLEGEEHQNSDDRSRVTSWTNSITNTATSQGTGGEWERQRLSVIKENGMHVSSTNLNDSTGHADPSPQRATLGPGASVDSQRVYSALMKRLEEAKLRETQNKLNGTDGSVAHGIVPPRSSSVDRWSARERSPSTIRCVQAEDDVFQDKKSRFEFHDTPSSPTSAPRSERNAGSETASPAYKAYPNPVARDCRGLSPGKSVKSRSRLESPTAVPHRSSAFFASPTYHMFRTASPFRRALQENMKTSREPQQLFSPETAHLNSVSSFRLPYRRPSASDSERDPRVGYTESIYSSPPGDVQVYKPKGDRSVTEKSPAPSRSDGHGDATIFVGPPAYKPNPSHHRDISTASSVEWKTWLSANVSKLEDNHWDAQPSPPAFGHVREDAEIDSPGEILKPEAYNPWRTEPDTPLKTIEGNSRSNSAQHMPYKAAEQSPTPVDENSALMVQEYHLKPPTIPSRSNLRAQPSLPSIKVEPCGTNDENSIPRVRTYNTMGPSRSSAMSREELRKPRSLTRFGETTSSVKSSPGLTAAVERQFGRAGSEPPMSERRERLIYTPRGPAYANTDSTGRAALMGSDLEAQVMGSKRMVDLFLSSRRKRVQGSRGGTGSDSSPAAFL